MPQPAEFQLPPELFPLRKEFVVFPKRLLRGGWIWGTVYHRRVRRDIPNPAELPTWRIVDEYLTEAQAIMIKLEGQNA